MSADSIITVFEFFFGLAIFFYVLFMGYSIYNSVEDVVKHPKKKGGVDYGGDIEKAVLEDAVNEMAVTTVGECGGYVQNNNAFIEKQLRIFTPYFDARRFLDFAQNLFNELIKTRGAQSTPLVSSRLDLMKLPYSAAYFDGCYIHNYIILDSTENLKVFCAIMTEGDELCDSTREMYFLTFSRENPLIKLKNGRFLAISCPNCGGEINIDKKLVSECPYCHSTVTFAEYDWVLTNIEHINDSTRICNLPVLRNISI